MHPKHHVHILGVVIHTGNPSTTEEKAGGSEVQGQPELQEILLQGRNERMEGERKGQREEGGRKGRKGRRGEKEGRKGNWQLGTPSFLVSLP